MGMSIGNFIAGNIKQQVKSKNLNPNRYLQMEPFPFTSKAENELHRKQIIGKAGIFIFIYGDLNENTKSIEDNGMWKEYVYAKTDKNNIIIALPCGNSSVSKKIYECEMQDSNSFTYIYRDLIKSFNMTRDNSDFFNKLVEYINLTVRQRLDNMVSDIIDTITRVS